MPCDAIPVRVSFRRACSALAHTDCPEWRGRPTVESRPEEHGIQIATHLRKEAKKHAEREAQRAGAEG